MRKIDKFFRKLEIYLAKIVTRDKLSFFFARHHMPNSNMTFFSVKANLFSGEKNAFAEKFL
jgi:hypothetical protein